MPPSKSNSPGPEPGSPAIAIDAELAGRLVAALELIGTAIAADDASGARPGAGGHRPAGPVDPVRVRVACDYNVLRGLLGRADAPRPLRMQRVKTGGGPKSVSDNAVVVVDQLPASARYAVVESPGDGSSGLEREPFNVEGNSTPTLALTDIPSTIPISRVEIFDHNHTLVAFGPSAGPIA